MEIAVILLNAALSLILIGTGLFIWKKHSPYPDFSSGYHHKAAMESRESWESANRLAGKVCIIEGVLLLLIVPAVFFLGLQGGAFFGVWMACALLAILLAVFFE